MKLFAEIISGFKQLTIFATTSILNIWMGSDYACGYKNNKRPTLAEAHSESSQTSKMKPFSEIINRLKLFCELFLQKPSS